MLAYIIRRVAYLVPVLLVLTVVVFTFVEMLPGNIIDTLVGTEGNNDPEVRKILEKEYGLDQPVYVRYAKWLFRAVQGDFGMSLVTRRPVSVELLSGIPATVYLAVVGISLSMLIAVPLGTIAAVKRNTPIDYTAQVTSLIGISIPEFWFAILCVLFFSLYLGWLPSSGFANPFEDPWASLQVPDPAGGRGRLPAGRLHHAADALEHARRDEQGIRRHRPLGRPQREQGDLQVHAAQRHDPDHHHQRPAARQSSRRHGGAGIDLRLARHRAGDLRGDPAARLSAGPGRACWCWAASSWS